MGWTLNLRQSQLLKPRAAASSGNDDDILLKRGRDLRATFTYICSKKRTVASNWLFLYEYVEAATFRYDARNNP